MVMIKAIQENRKKTIMLAKSEKVRMVEPLKKLTPIT
jgi:hypothetical protein